MTSNNNNNDNGKGYEYITIGNYNFILVSKNESNTRVFIISEKCSINNNGKNCNSNSNETMTNTNFIVYRSNSNTGFWRICVNKLYDTQFDYIYKGNNDYIQQTFVHFQLQKFINDNLTNIKDNTLEDIKTCNVHYMSKEFGFNRIKNIETHIDNKSRKLFFDYYKKINKCGQKTYNPDELKKFSKLLYDNYRVTNLILIYENYNFEYGNKDFKYKINGDIYSVELIQTNKHNNTLKKNNNTTLKKNNSLKKNNNTNHKHKKTNINNTFKKLDLVFFAKNSKFTNKTNNTISSIPLDSSIPLVLYFLKYNLIIETTKLTKNINSKATTQTFYNQYIPILLTNKNSRITKYGLYSNYIMSGNYICKVFDYTKQCSDIEKEKQCFGEYTYIGDRYNNLFPFEDEIIKKTKQITIT